MGSQIKKGATTLRERQVQLPVVGRNHSVTVKVVVKLEDTAQCTLRDELLEGDKVRVPSSVLVNDEELAVLLGNLDELVGLGRGGNKRLLSQDMLSGLESSLCEFKVVVGRSTDDDQVDIGVGKELLIVCVVLDVGVVSRR
ncbi:hypothetical protein HG531_009909 [Fusarium graminearum]|nr:hypothetical protein HG531_009909 [Fusarium graminearum]